jgi:DNA-binding PucR family transcriptional regulator
VSGVTKNELQRRRGTSRLAAARNDRNVELTARDLEIHSNTVRQRLARFEETTGCSLRDTETLAEVWWALQRWRLG